MPIVPSTPQPNASWYVPVPKPGDVDYQTQKTMNAIQENLERLAGIRSGGDFSLITATDMVDSSYLNALAGQPQSIVNVDVDPGENPWGAIPPKPTSLHIITHSDTGIASPWNHHLEWTNPEDLTNIYYIEVWSSTIDDVGTASRIAIVTPPQNSLMVYGIILSVDYYYWIRSISYGYKKSLWEPNPDTQGGYLVVGIDTVGETIDNVIDILAGETPPAWDATVTYQIGEMVSYTTGSPSTTRRFRAVAESLNEVPWAAAYDTLVNTTYWERTGILMTGEVDGVATVGIDGNLVVDGSILADAIYTEYLSSIVADIGAITAGTLSSSDWDTALGIRVDLTNKWLKMGGSSVTAAGAAAGIFLGWDTDAYKFYVGDVGTKFLKWDGTDLTVQGDIKASDITGSTISASSFVLGTTGSLHSVDKDSYADTTAGIFIGYDTGVYTLNVGATTDYLKWSGSALYMSGQFYGAAAGNFTEAHRIPIQVFTLTASYTKVFEFTIGRGGTYRITWDWNKLWSYGNEIQRCRIYRNGTGVGVEKTLSAVTTYYSLSDDIAGWAPGDLLQLYVGSDYAVSGTGNVKNFRVKTANPIQTVSVEDDL